MWKEGKKHLSTKGAWKWADAISLISNEVCVKSDLVGRHSHFIAFKGTSRQEAIGVLNIYALALAHTVS